MSSLHAEDVFLSHYQLSHDPFAARVPNFKFFPAQRKPLLAQLLHLARYSQLLLLVTGPKGSGKTLLRQALVATCNKQTVLPVVLNASAGSTAQALLLQISQVLGLPGADSDTIQRHIQQLAQTGQAVFLLVDDAEQLGSEALAELLVLAQGPDEGRAHVFLFGESQTADKLAALSEEGEEERFHVIELQPYSEEETRDYLALRLEGAGQGIELLSDEQIREIHERAAGWPGAINEAARDLMFEAMMEERGLLRPAGFQFNLPRRHQLGLLGILLAVAAGWLWLGSGSDEPAGEAQAARPAAPVERPAITRGAESSVPRVEFANAPQPLPLPSEPVQTAAPAAAPQPQPEPGQATPAATSLPLPAGAEVASPAAPRPEPAAEPVAAAPEPAPASAPAPIAALPLPEPEPIDASAPQPPAAPVQVASLPLPASRSAIEGPSTDWYLSQAGQRYALQVLAVSSEQAARDFVRELGGDYRYYRKIHQGKPLFVVTTGSFADQKSAKDAIDRLPEKVRAGKPWARTFAGIQREIARP